MLFITHVRYAALPARVPVALHPPRPVPGCPVDPNSGVFKAGAAFIGFYPAFYAIARYLYRNKIFIKL